MSDVTMVSPPDDGSDGIGTYTGDLIASFPDEVEVEHVTFPPDSANPVPIHTTAIVAGWSDGDVIHVQHEYALFGPVSVYSWSFFLVLFILARFRGRHLVVTLHSAWNDETVAGTPLAGLKRLYVAANNRLLVGVSEQVVFLSESCRASFFESVVPDEYEVFPHGVRTTETRDISRTDARATFGYGPDESLVVEPGYVREQKGTHVFVDIAERLRDQEFLVAGGTQGPQEEAYIRALKERAPPNVRFTGHLDEERFHAAFVAADVVCLPYLRMTQSGIFNWCAAYGVPVAAADHEYFVRINDEWDCVALFDPDDVNDGADTVMALLDSRERRDEIAANLRGFREANSFDHVAENHARLYRQMVNA